MYLMIRWIFTFFHREGFSIMKTQPKKWHILSQFLLTELIKTLQVFTLTLFTSFFFFSSVILLFTLFFFTELSFPLCFFHILYRCSVKKKRSLVPESSRTNSSLETHMALDKALSLRHDFLTHIYTHFTGWLRIRG